LLTTTVVETTPVVMASSPQPGTIWWRLQWARTAAGISARHLDRLAGLALGHTSLLEAEKKQSVELPTVRALARVLGVTLDWLVEGKVDESNPHPTREKIAEAIARAQAQYDEAHPEAVAS
jgi:transcriptional regulator with XRE-family HTH domain